MNCTQCVETGWHDHTHYTPYTYRIEIATIEGSVDNYCPSCRHKDLHRIAHDRHTSNHRSAEQHHRERSLATRIRAYARRPRDLIWRYASLTTPSGF